MPIDQRKRLSRPRAVRLDSEWLSRLDTAVAAIPISRGGRTRREPSPEESVVLRKFWHTGRPIEAMARGFGVSEGTLRRWVREAGL